MIAELHTNNFKYMISVWSNPSGIVGKALQTLPHGLIPKSQWMDVYNPAVRNLEIHGLRILQYRSGRLVAGCDRAG